MFLWLLQQVFLIAFFFFFECFQFPQRDLLILINRIFHAFVVAEKLRKVFYLDEVIWETVKDLRALLRMIHPSDFDPR